MDERRRASRLKCVLPIRLYLQDELQVIETLAKDIGSGGLKVLAKSATPLATPVSLELVFGPGESPVHLEATVVWCEPMTQSDQCHLGIEFQHLTVKNRARLSTYLEKLTRRLHASPE
ncbi:MAG: PilZ domain-containing protein [Candidatus Omnitrophica bacterium]|nr:PilZ domain-containing protein [Candidatus Omnitrophota bacterium]